MSIEKVINLYQGFHFEGELRALNRLAAGVSEGVIVSIGSYRGQGDCALALHAHMPVFCIDPRQKSGGEDTPFGDADRQFWFENANSLGLIPKLRPINLPSLDVAKIWTEPIGMLWIDGDHSLAEDDLNAWMPHVVEGGLVALHDANSSSVLRAVTSRTDLVEIERANLTVVCRKESLFEEFSDGVLELWVRKGPYNQDDKYVLGEVRSYDIGAGPFRNFIDVGAHIGAFSNWIIRQHPNAIGIAVEPELTAYSALNRNMPAGSMHVNAAVAYGSAPHMLLIDPLHGGSHQVVAADTVVPGQYAMADIESVTLEQLMAEEKWNALDLLKLDCEGSEQDILLNASEDCLKRIRRIVGEFHFGYENFMQTIGARLQGLGFAVTAQQDPAAHSTFVAVNQNTRAADSSEKVSAVWTMEDATPVTGQIQAEQVEVKHKRPVSRAGKGRMK